MFPQDPKSSTSPARSGMHQDRRQSGLIQQRSATRAPRSRFPDPIVTPPERAVPEAPSNPPPYCVTSPPTTAPTYTTAAATTSTTNSVPVQNQKRRTSTGDPGQNADFAEIQARMAVETGAVWQEKPKHDYRRTSTASARARDCSSRGRDSGTRMAPSGLHGTSSDVKNDGFHKNPVLSSSPRGSLTVGVEVGGEQQGGGSKGRSNGAPNASPPGMIGRKQQHHQQGQGH